MVPFARKSSFVDASVVYGSTQEWHDKLRVGVGGLLKVSAGPNGDLLPLNGDLGLDMAPGGNTSHLFAAGDFRANVNLPMVVWHTLFHLEHNHRARKLAAANPGWDDEKLFNEARRWVIAVTQNDLKRVLAYSTVSQLGFMFLSLGVGSFAGMIAAMFHLFTHAFFKALLFLGAGSVMHAMGGVIDIRRFGGLRKIMPITHWTFLITETEQILQSCFSSLTTL